MKILASLLYMLSLNSPDSGESREKPVPKAVIVVEGQEGVRHRISCRGGSFLWDSEGTSPAEHVLSIPNRFESCELQVLDLPFTNDPLILNVIRQDVYGGIPVVREGIRGLQIPARMLHKTDFPLE